jgi:DNA-binding NtrC family response regulator
MSQESSPKIPVLYVDNDKDSAEIILHWLEMNGCEAVSVSTGAAALTLLIDQKFEVCITEYLLPDCTGFELFQQARIECPGMAFILNTGDLRPVIKQEAALAGIYLLPKPTDLELLHHIVDSITHCSSSTAS